MIKFNGKQYPISPNPKYQPYRPYKLKVYSKEESDTKDDINQKLMQKAMHQSYTREISLGSKGESNEVFDIIAAMLFENNNTHNKSQTKLSTIFWCIVELDEQRISELAVSQSNISLCQPNVNNVPFDEPISLKFYQLYMTLEGKDIKLQSLEDPQKYLIFNFDTIQTEFITIYQQNPYYEQLIEINVLKKVRICMYINEKILPFYFKRNQKNKLLLKPTAKRIKLEIQNILKKGIKQSRGKQFQIKDLPIMYPLYYKTSYASEEQFNDYCQTGDLLLFQDNHTMAKVQRFVTNSEYDHVGIVYRSDKYGICIFQSSSGLGVALTVWNHLLRQKWFKNIQTIAWRRLQLPSKSKNFNNKVKEFVNLNLYKRFGISLPKLLRFKSIQRSSQQQKKKTYFCSELVATLYQHLGLINCDDSPTQYWPKHFSDKGSLKMLQNSALSHERQIIFNEDILKEKHRFYK